MPFDYALLRTETVEPLLEEFGGPGVLSVNDLSSNPPYESQIVSATTYPVTVVRTQYKKSNVFSSLVEGSDTLFLISTKNVIINPELADRLIVDGVTYQNIMIEPLKPGPVVMLWKVKMRK